MSFAGIGASGGICTRSTWLEARNAAVNTSDACEQRVLPERFELSSLGYHRVLPASVREYVRSRRQDRAGRPTLRSVDVGWG